MSSSKSGAAAPVLYTVVLYKLATLSLKVKNWLRHFEMAIKFEKIFHSFRQSSCFYSVASKQVEDFFQIFVAFSKKLDFKLKTISYMLHWAQNFEWADIVRINGKRNALATPLWNSTQKKVKVCDLISFFLHTSFWNTSMIIHLI